MVVDVLNVANWQRGGDSKVPRPKPLTRPGIGPKPIPNLHERLERLAQKNAQRGR